ncbi:MAG: response regulator [Oscillospiraceae bacterium]|jgi:CheY-like chemotaxis protein|nr:response regulator [Oscillospiraceae bacterium]
MQEQKNSILIVEDSDLNIIILSDILGSDYILHTALDGVEGLAKAKEERPDLILLDIVLPKMDGYEVLKALKDSQETKEIPVVIVTSLNEVDDERRGLQLGAADFINKPYDPITVRLRVDIQMRMIEQLRTITLLSAEVAQWLQGGPDK